MQIPFEDNFEDILGKAQRGLELSDDALAARAGISTSVLRELKSGRVLEEPARLVAPCLGLHADSLLALSRGAWHPAPVEVGGLLALHTNHHGMAVNHYLVFDPESKSAALFDTGADAAVTLSALQKHSLKLERIYLTHTHPDHIAVLPALQRAFPEVAVKVGRGELFTGAEPVDEGMTFTLGKLAIEARETAGHSRGGITYVIQGLAQPLAIVGDALFAGSMGGAAGAWTTALTANRDRIFPLSGYTVICPGHGPLTTMAEERAHNPFYPEFKPTAH